MTNPDPIDAGAPAADAPSAIAGRLLSVTRQLAVLLERETALLRTVDAPALVQLQKGKAELVATHAMLWGQLRAIPDSLESLSASLYEELKAEAATLSATAAANERKLRAACQATDRLLAIIVDAVRKQRGDGLAYGEGGAAPRPASGATSGLTFNKDI